MKGMMDDYADDHVEFDLPIDGFLDLHTFHPSEIKELICDYIAACLDKGILSIQIVHGKGTGQLRRTVHSVLNRLPEVVSFRLGAEETGGWGVTIVDLEAPSSERNTG
jgi:dsDNA-specific endonuclease/ATPase MutS2